jgi:anti-sigma factor ChrR (cupin superfamily)
MPDTIDHTSASNAGADPRPPDLVWADVIGNGFNRPDLPWQPWGEHGRVGVDVCPIFTNEQTGPEGAAALLVRFRPGAHGDFHEHRGFELMLVLDGVLEDDKGGYFPAGTLALEAPGSIHQALSRQGCTVLAVRERPATAFTDQPFDAHVRRK